MNYQSPEALMTDLLTILKKPVASFVYSKFPHVEPDEFSLKIQEYLNHSQLKAHQKHPNMFDSRDSFTEHMDIHASLHLINKGWAEIPEKYPDSMREDARLLLENRNLWAHQEPFSRQDVEEVATIAIRFLNKMNTTSAGTSIKIIRQLLRHDYYRHIPTTEHYIARPDILEPIQDELLKYEQVSLSLHGMGGIGKSVLLRAICDEQSIQARFTDGILWMSFGSEVGPLQLAQKLKEWITALNGTTHDTNSSLDSLKNELAELLKNKAILLILDDIWTKQQLETFRVAGNNCRIIFSTRDAEIARDIGAKFISVRGMNDDQVTELLEKWSDGNFKDKYRLSLVKQAIFIRLGGLPLAVKLTGIQLQTKTPEQWLDNFDTRQIKSKRIEGVHDSLETTFELSLDELDENSRQLFFALSILQGSVIPEQVVMVLWQGVAQFDEHQTRELLDDLVARALCIEVKDDLPVRSIHISHLLRNLLLQRLENPTALHQVLVESYKKVQTGSGWHMIQDDGYFYAYFAHHLSQAGALGTLRDALLNYPFMQTRLNVADIRVLIGNYAYIDELDESLQAVLLVLMNHQTDLEEHPQQLPRILYENLIAVQDMSPEIASLLDDCYQLSPPNLFTINQMHFYPNGVITYNLPDGTSKVYRLRIGKEEVTQEEVDFLQRGSGGLLDFFDWTKRQDEQTLPDGVGLLARMLKGDIEILPKGANFLFGSVPRISQFSLNGVGQLMKFHSASIRSISLWGEYAISIDIENNFCVWSCRTGQSLYPKIVKISDPLDDTPSNNDQPTKPSNEPVQLNDTLTLTYYPDENYLQFRNSHTDEFVNIIPNQQQFYSDKLTISSEDEALNIYNAQTGDLITTVDVGEELLHFSLVMSEDSSIIALGTDYGYVHLLRPNAALIRLLRDNS